MIGGKLYPTKKLARAEKRNSAFIPIRKLVGLNGRRVCVGHSEVHENINGSK
jgi:hypothetical protein